MDSRLQEISSPRLTRPEPKIERRIDRTRTAPATYSAQGGSAQGDKNKTPPRHDAWRGSSWDYKGGSELKNQIRGCAGQAGGMGVDLAGRHGLMSQECATSLVWNISRPT